MILRNTIFSFHKLQFGGNFGRRGPLGHLGVNNPLGKKKNNDLETKPSIFLM